MSAGHEAPACGKPGLMVLCVLAGDGAGADLAIRGDRF
jgi:hypothetical protein